MSYPQQPWRDEPAPWPAQQVEPYGQPQTSGQPAVPPGPGQPYGQPAYPQYQQQPGQVSYPQQPYPAYQQPQPPYGYPPQQAAPYPHGRQQGYGQQPLQVSTTVVNHQSVKVTGRGPNHMLHGMLTLFTCGLWAPIWIMVTIFGRK